MKKAAKKSTTSTRAAVKKQAIKDLAAGQKAGAVKGGRKAVSTPTYGCSQ